MEIIRCPISDDCYSTIHLNDLRVRKESYYFDWLIIPFSSTFKLFETDFKDYLVMDRLVNVGKNNLKFKHVDIKVLDPKYHILYLHHFNNIEKDFIDVKSIFDRRIFRMLDKLQKNYPVEFYFKSISKKNKNNLKIINIDDSSWGDAAYLEWAEPFRQLIISKFNYQDPGLVKIIKIK
jgi:hypothetical protein